MFFILSGADHCLLVNDDQKRSHWCTGLVPKSATNRSSLIPRKQFSLTCFILTDIIWDWILLYYTPFYLAVRGCCLDFVDYVDFVDWFCESEQFLPHCDREISSVKQESIILFNGLRIGLLQGFSIHYLCLWALFGSNFYVILQIYSP